ERGLDLLGADVLPRALDDVLDPPEVAQPPPLVEDAEVARADPAVDERLRRRLRVVEVLEHDVAVAVGDLARLARAEAAVAVHDRDLDAVRGHADIPGRRVARPVARHAEHRRRARLGHAPGEPDADAEALAELLHPHV